MRKHTTHDTAPTIADDGVDYSALAAELEAIATRLHNATRGFSTRHWIGDEFEATEAALQAVKDAIVDAAVKHFAPEAIAAAWHAGAPDHPNLPKGFPLCPLLQQGTIQADLSNAWRLIDQAIDNMRGDWEAPEMRRCVVLLFGALAVIECAETKAADGFLASAVMELPPWQDHAEADQAPAPALSDRDHAEEADRVARASLREQMQQAPALSDRDRAEERDRQANASHLADFAAGRADADRAARASMLEQMQQAPALSDRDRAEERDRQANASHLADFAAGRADADRAARASMLEQMQQATPQPRALSPDDLQFHRLWSDLNDASSLLTDASCAMSGGWSMKELERCDAMVSGAKALIDRGRAYLEEQDAAYLRVRSVAAHDQAHTEGQQAGVHHG